MGAIPPRATGRGQYRAYVALFTAFAALALTYFIFLRRSSVTEAPPTDDPLPAPELEVSPCHKYGPVHLCKVHNVLYQGGTVSDAWQEGVTIPLHVSRTDLEDPESHVRTLPGPCTLQSGPPPGCGGNKVELRGMNASKLEAVCATATTYDDPVVFVYRNYINPMHWLSDQAVPFYFSLLEFGLTDTPVQVIALDEHRYREWHSSDEQVARRELEWERFSGRPVVKWRPALNQTFCARTVIVGDPGHILTSYEMDLSPETILQYRPKYQSYVDWVMRKYNTKYPDAHSRDLRNPAVTLVDRTSARFRSILNMQEVIQVARQVSSRTQAVRFEEMSVKEQVRIISQTDVYIVMHGAALAWNAFLPPWGVAVELRPYGFGTAFIDFYAGHCQWARLAGRSYMSWHNRNKTASIIALTSEEAWYLKDYNTFIDPGNVTFMVGAAVNLSVKPMYERNKVECIRLNEPVDPKLDGWKDQEVPKQKSDS